MHKKSLYKALFLFGLTISLRVKRGKKLAFNIEEIKKNDQNFEVKSETLFIIIEFERP